MKPVVKCLLVLNSILITVLGAGLTLVGVIIKFYTELIDGYLTPIIKLLSAGGGTGADIWTLYNMNSIALLAFGVAVIISGFFGCYVAACPKKQTVTAYMVIMTVMIMLQITSAAFILTMKVENEIKDTLKINLVNMYYGDEAKDEYSSAWNYAMVEFSCCGAESAGDFKLAINWDHEKTGDNGTYTVTVPVTCCKLPGKYPGFGEPNNENCTVNPTTENSYYQQGLSLAILVAVSMEMKRKRNKIKQALVDESQD
ncbi:tetraspanin-1-like isoform X2 [Mercenaria mercenaria]|uniref:tetraspanin-1-like isoform X2 n=1 Tax=Mercenaria mercenaria TaxID=6596 RepID=UPI00234E950D|nr:tetraspanin-1-like isoform X2 [Mercenaria mercenaria]